MGCWSGTAATIEALLVTTLFGGTKRWGGSGRRCFGVFGFEGGAKEPVVFEALNELIGVRNGLRDGAEQIGVGLDLVIQIAGHIRKII